MINKVVKDFLYYEQFGLGKKENTIKSYRRDLNQFLAYLVSTEEEIEDFKEIGEIHFRGFTQYLGQEKISKRSVNRKLSTLRTFFKYLLNKGLIEKNPTLFLASPQFETSFPELIRKEEFSKLRDIISLKKANGIRDRLIIELLYSSGIRANELLSLSERLIDIQGREIKIISSNKSERVVFFSETTKRYLLDYLEYKKEKYKENYNSEILFVNGQGTRLSDRSLRRIIDRYVKRAMLEKEISPHTFRHTFGINMVLNGMKLEYIKELMGHVSIESTKIYEEHLKIIDSYSESNYIDREA